MGFLDLCVLEARFMAGVIWSMLPDAQKWTSRRADIQKKLEREA